MFETIKIKNFKSIVDDQIKLTPLTVIVGANGSGKSNLIKAIEFLGAVPRVGLTGAVNRCGGMQALVPKAVARKDLKTTRIRFEYRSLLPSLPGYVGSNLPPLAVKHLLELASARKEAARIRVERLTYYQPLAIAEVLGCDRDEERIDKARLSESSIFTLQRGPRGAIKYDGRPSLAKALPGYVQWSGFAFAQEAVKSVSALKKLLDSSAKRLTGLHPSTSGERSYQSFLDPGMATVVDRAPQAQIFLRMLMEVKRYDLLLSELRPEQQVSEARQLSTVGNNMPSLLRHIRSTSESSWNRILRTLGSISPHIESMRASSLRTGKEFVEFVEDTAARGVESWESSDGALRALAILLALETHSTHSTLLIEEPEQNLHPWAIREIVEHIRQVIEERHVQVILTTHSEHVLERVYSDEVLIATRTEQEGTKFRTLKEILPHKKIMMGEVAQLWVKGLLGGVPSDEC